MEENRNQAGTMETETAKQSEKNSFLNCKDVSRN